MSQPLLFDFYQQLMLDKEWVNPGLDGYYLLGKLMESPHFKPACFEDLAQALETIWLKSQNQQGRFRQLLEDRRLHLLDALAALQDAQKQGPANLPNLPPQEEQPPMPEPYDQTPTFTPSVAETPADNAPVKQENKKTDDTPTTDRELDFDSAAGFSISYKDANASDEFVLKQQQEENSQSEVDRPYFFTNDYFPIKNRHLQQAWRSLKSKKEAGDGPDISISRTIGHTARQGYFSGFAFNKKTTNQLQLFILIDESDTMIAVEEFGREICQAAVASDMYAALEPLYFNKLPWKDHKNNDYSVTTENLTPNTTLAKLFAPYHRKDILVLIYSDAGTFRDELDQQRVTRTKEFIRWLFQRTGYTAWLNPAPRHRWINTNAELLQNDVQMFEAGRGDFENAIAVLKGKLVHHPTNNNISDVTSTGRLAETER